MVKKYIYTLPFLIGSFSEVSQEIISQMIQNKGTLLLPCDLASISQAKIFSQSYRHIDYCTTDGMPLVCLGQLKFWHHAERVYGPDLMRIILQHPQIQSKRHFFYGSTNQADLEKLLLKISGFAPDLNRCGAVSPPLHNLKPTEEQLLLAKIQAAKPEVIWIGLSSPLQITFGAQIKKMLPNATILCVGAAFDFIAEVKPSAPNWMKKSCLEWFFRLITEPKRLWKRYLLVIPKFLLMHGTELLFS